MARKSKTSLLKLNKHFVYSSIVDSSDLNVLEDGLKNLSKKYSGAIDCLEFIKWNPNYSNRHREYSLELIGALKYGLSKERDVPRDSDFKTIIREFKKTLSTNFDQALILLEKFPFFLLFELEKLYNSGTCLKELLSALRRNPKLASDRIKYLKFKNKHQLDFLTSKGRKYRLPTITTNYLVIIFEEYSNEISEPHFSEWLKSVEKLYFFFKKIFK
jgi:hypothetical protein